MPNTLKRNYPYPTISEAPDGPYSFQKMAEAIDTDVDAVAGRLVVPRLQIYRRMTGGNNANNPWGPGSMAELSGGVVAAASSSSASFTYPANDQIKLPGVAGSGDAWWYLGWTLNDFRDAGTDTASTPATGWAYIAGARVYAATDFSNRGDVSLGQRIFIPGGDVLTFKFQTNVSIRCGHTITLVKDVR